MFQLNPYNVFNTSFIIHWLNTLQICKYEYFMCTSFFNNAKLYSDRINPILQPTSPFSCLINFQPDNTQLLVQQALFGHHIKKQFIALLPNHPPPYSPNTKPPLLVFSTKFLVCWNPSYQLLLSATQCLPFMHFTLHNNTAQSVIRTGCCVRAISVGRFFHQHTHTPVCIILERRASWGSLN